MRQAITYLASRPDVEPDNIGASGLSFGGVNTFYTWLVDLRLAAAAPICGAVGSMDVLARTGHFSYHGLYIWIPGLLTKGDEADFAAAMAPRPLMVWGPTEDIAMPREGEDQFVAKVRPAYERAGAAEKFVVYQRPGALTPEAFELMVRFFDARLKH
jgi:dienelactone hydrolase